jgi:hypothetical protein
LRGEGHDETRAEFVHRAALAGRHATGTRDKAADAASMQGFFLRGVGAGIGWLAFSFSFGFGGSWREFVRQAGVVWIVDHCRCCYKGEGLAACMACCEAPFAHARHGPQFAGAVRSNRCASPLPLQKSRLHGRRLVLDSADGLAGRWSGRCKCA